MKLVFIHGPVASGKLTIASELAQIIRFPLFHNHLTVDLLLSLFPFGSAPFIKHREKIWLEMMSDAAAAGTNLIFTFNPENTVSPDFPDRLLSRITDQGGSIFFVEISCPQEEIVRRLEAPSRKAYQKLSSVELYRTLMREGAFDYPALPADLRIDPSALLPQEAARLIASRLENT